MIRHAWFGVIALLVSLSGLAASKSPRSGPGYQLIVASLLGMTEKRSS
ncbi:MAG TPA: hypothetical protein VGK86_11995 [Thermoanaerobaculia bacterium]|jgi:hypothetical protein